jgi:hypothetical protein
MSKKSDNIIAAVNTILILTIVQVANIQLNTLRIFTTTRRSVVGVIRGSAIVRWRSGIVFTAAFGGAGARAGA